MSAIPASFLPPRALWPERIYRLPERAGNPHRVNATGATDPVRGRSPRTHVLLRAGQLGSAGAGTGKLLRRVVREQAARG
jgi:hypothetical protein